MLMFLMVLIGLIIGFLIIEVNWVYILISLMLVCFVWGVSGYSENSLMLISDGFTLDILSWSLIYLSVWVSGLMILASFNIFFNSNNEKEFLLMVILLLLSLMVTFSISDYLWFYIFFEMSLIPTLLLILGWGYQPERLQAGLYMLFYTLFGSLPLLISILLLDGKVGSLSYFLMWGQSISSCWWYLCMMLGFLIKMPMFLTHLWLPKAHVEAPISGSMILAGVLLKLGGYGLFRVLVLFVYMNSLLNIFWISISLWGGFIMSLLCLRQYDLKALIAYSSVVHMGMVLAGMMTLNSWGFQGALVLMIGHGLCSSGLFSLANIMYERVGSRSFLLNSGMMSFFPSMSFWWFMLSISNMAAPPSLNLFGEISLMISLISWFDSVFVLLILISFFSAAYTIFMYSITQHGKGLVKYFMLNCKSREYLISALHWIPLNFLLLSGDLVFSWI